MFSNFYKSQTDIVPAPKLRRSARNRGKPVEVTKQFKGQGGFTELNVPDQTPKSSSRKQAAIKPPVKQSSTRLNIQNESKGKWKPAQSGPTESKDRSVAAKPSKNTQSKQTKSKRTQSKEGKVGSGIHTEDPPQTQPLSREALERLNRSLNTFKAKDLQKSVDFRYQNLASPSDSGTSKLNSLNPREEFYIKWGYLPELDKEAARIIAAIMENPESAKKAKRTYPSSSEFIKGLEYRKVELSRSYQDDPREDILDRTVPDTYLQETSEEKTCYEKLWELDRAKGTDQPCEAIFQRTLMISLISRHNLRGGINDKPGILDYSVEENWTCPPMPSKAFVDYKEGEDISRKLCTQPRPDLAVCFRYDSIFTNGIWLNLPMATQELACFESLIAGRSRVFHFLVVEAKNAMKSLDNGTALSQCLNAASQALFNMFEFLKDADKDYKSKFFDKVRFFSMTANNHGLVVRLHRAVELPEDADPELDLIIKGRPDYRLVYTYRELVRISYGDKCGREDAVRIFRKLMHYAVEELHPLFKAAARDLAKKIVADKTRLLQMEREKTVFYRYGIDIPSEYSKKGTPKTSKARSLFSQDPSMNQQFESIAISSSYAQSGITQSARSGISTLRGSRSQKSRTRGAQHRSTSKRSSNKSAEKSDSQKRKLAETQMLESTTDTDELAHDADDSQPQPVPKRRRQPDRQIRNPVLEHSSSGDISGNSQISVH